MSHFTVAVISDPKGKTVEELLAPYQENNMDDCPEEYLEFVDETEEVINNFEKHKDEYSSIEKFAKDYYGYEINENGKYGYVENPNAKWDWYQVGGRWSGSLKLKSNALSGERGSKSWQNASVKLNDDEFDSAKIGDIDFSPDMKEYNKAIRFWELYVDGQEAQNSEDKELIEWCFYKPDYYKNRYLNKELYAKTESEFSTYAVITPDGVWHSKGDMGWWGCSSESDEENRAWHKSFYETFIQNTNPDFYLTVVDCHI